MQNNPLVPWSTKYRLRVFLSLFATAFCGSSAQGALILTLDQPVQGAAPGSIVEFKGSIENTGPETLGLVDVVFTPIVTPPPFETGIPLVLLFLFKPGPGGKHTGTVFAVQIDESASVGDVMNTVVTIQDRAGLVAPSNGVAVQLTATPEPASMLLVGSAALGVLAFRRRSSAPDAVPRRHKTA